MSSAPMNARFAVAGVVNMEISVPVDGWPVVYEPVRFVPGQVSARAGGVGFNVAVALSKLGCDVAFATLVADDRPGQAVRAELIDRGLWGETVVQGTATPRSVVLHSPDGTRMVSTDLRGQVDATYPPRRFGKALESADWAVITNIGFARPLLALAQQAEVPVAADVQAIDDLHDPYNADWMAAAEILFCSHEKLPTPPAEWVEAVQTTYGTSIVVVGMGPQGALLKTRAEPPRHVPAVAPRGVHTTVGAGDALAAGFLATYARTGDPDAAIEAAVWTAGWKIGAAADDDPWCDWEQRLRR